MAGVGQGLRCHICGYTPSDGGVTSPDCPHDGSLLVSEEEHRQAPRDPFLGHTLGGKYRISGILGFGGMGAVYRALQMPMGREVAVKLVRGQGGENAEAAARFRREAEVIARLDHPAVVTLHDYGIEPDGTQYMVLELVRGETLATLLRQGPLERPRFLRVIGEVLDSLVAAHHIGLVHRDLKPANIMIARSSAGRETVRVLDFGIAKVLSESLLDGDPLTGSGISYGTPQYMSPEQAMNQRVDFRSDLYSVGVILFEGLLGQLPFQGESDFAICEKQVHAPLPDMKGRVPAELERLIRRALAKEPGRRFQSAAEMQQALQEVEFELYGSVREELSASSRANLSRVVRSQPVLPPSRSRVFPAPPPIGRDADMQLRRIAFLLEAIAGRAATVTWFAALTSGAVVLAAVLLALLGR